MQKWKDEVTVYLWKVVGVVFLLILSGCSATPVFTPTPQKEPAPVKLVNNASMTERFEVGVVNVESNLTITMEDGESYNYSPGQGSSTYVVNPKVENKFANISFPKSAQVHGVYTLEPGESKVLSVENVAPNQAIVVLVYDKPEGTYRAIKSLSCGSAILGYRVRPQKGGSEDWTPGTYACG